MVDDYRWVKRAKYYKVNFPFGDCGVSEIKDDSELQLWLEDGSLEGGNIIIQAIEIYKVDEEVTRERTIHRLGETLINKEPHSHGD